MYAKLTFHIDFSSDEFVDLTEFGHEPQVTWNDLTDKEQDEIKENFESSKQVYALGEHLCPIRNRNSYDDGALMILEEMGLID